MKRLLCMTAALALTATAAMAQSDPYGRRQGYDVFFRTGSAANAEAAGLIEQISEALDKSRSLQLVTVVDPDTPTVELEAPLNFTKESDGRVTVSYEMSPARGAAAGRTYKTTCKITQVERCAVDIVTRVERYAREMEAALRPSGLPPGF